MPAQPSLMHCLKEKPAACTRLGSDIFLEVPLYRSQQRHRPIYINREVFQRLFPQHPAQTWEEMAAALTPVFSTTIEPEKATGEQIGTAYIDRQADPLDLSLSGNLGSGRAYYAGKYFNIKGEKTPLATSAKRKFSDGLLEMERTIWETVIANALQGSFSNGLNEVLAILDMDELCSVEWRDTPVKRAKIVRVDMDGALDRVTHFFLNPRPLSRSEWHETARSYGRLEADKLIERMTHGTWSPGNISLHGHLIDFDTVCAVKGRGPLYSSTQWYADNRFGFEHRGQLKILEALAADVRINTANITPQELKQEMMTTWRDHLGQRFVQSMGFPAPDAVYTGYTADINDLIDLFLPLADKIYKKRGLMMLKDEASHGLHAFDFSAFFRIYPMAKRLDAFSPQKMLAMMSANEMIDAPFNETPKTLTPIEQEHQDAVDAVINDCFITSADEFELLCLGALHFIKKYDKLHGRILQESGGDMCDIERRAYIFNEDRFYLLPAFTPSFKIAQNTHGWSDQKLHGMIEAFIRASRRIPDEDITDIRLYGEGFVYRRMLPQGTHVLGFFPYEPLNDIPHSINFNDMTYPLINGGETAEIDNDAILAHFSRNASLYVPEAVLEFAHRQKRLHSLLDNENN